MPGPGEGRPWRLGPKALRGRRLPASEALAVGRMVQAELAEACRWQNAVARLGWVPAWAESPEQTPS